MLLNNGLAAGVQITREFYRDKLRELVRAFSVLNESMEEKDAANYFGQLEQRWLEQRAQYKCIHVSYLNNITPANTFFFASQRARSNQYVYVA